MIYLYRNLDMILWLVIVSNNYQSACGGIRLFYLIVLQPQHHPYLLPEVSDPSHVLSCFWVVYFLFLFFFFWNVVTILLPDELQSYFLCVFTWPLLDRSSQTHLLQAEGDVGLGNSGMSHSHHKHCWALTGAYAGESQIASASKCAPC